MISIEFSSQYQNSVTNKCLKNERTDQQKLIALTSNKCLQLLPQEKVWAPVKRILHFHSLFFSVIFLWDQKEMSQLPFIKFLHKQRRIWIWSFLSQKRLLITAFLIDCKEKIIYFLNKCLQIWSVFNGKNAGWVGWHVFHQVLFLLLFHWLEISLGLQGRGEGIFARK